MATKKQVEDALLADFRKILRAAIYAKALLEKRYGNIAPGGISFEDIIQKCCVRLLRNPAIWDPDRGDFEKVITLMARSEVLNLGNTKEAQKTSRMDDLMTFSEQGLRKTIPPNQEHFLEIMEIERAIKKTDLDPITRKVAECMLHGLTEPQDICEHLNSNGVKLEIDKINNAKKKIARKLQAMLENRLISSVPSSRKKE